VHASPPQKRLDTEALDGRQREMNMALKERYREKKGPAVLVQGMLNGQ